MKLPKNISGASLFWDRLKCPDYKGVLISGSEVNTQAVSYLGHIQVSLIQRCPHFRGLE